MNTYLRMCVNIENVQVSDRTRNAPTRLEVSSATASRGTRRQLPTRTLARTLTSVKQERTTVTTSV